MESKQFDHFEGAGRQMVLHDPIHVTVAQNFYWRKFVNTVKRRNLINVTRKTLTGTTWENEDETKSDLMFQRTTVVPRYCFFITWFMLLSSLFRT